MYRSPPTRQLHSCRSDLAAARRFFFSAISPVVSSGRLRTARSDAAKGGAAGSEFLPPVKSNVPWPSRSPCCGGRSLGCVLVIPRERLVGGVRDALAKHFQIEDAEERVAAQDVGIEEAEWLSGLDGFNPQRDLG